MPSVLALWAYERHGADLGVGTTLGCFLTGGILGVLGASLMEYYLLHPSLWMFVDVGPRSGTACGRRSRVRRCSRTGIPPQMRSTTCSRCSRSAASS